MSRRSGWRGTTATCFDVEYPSDVTPFWDEKQITAIGAWLRRLPKPVAVMACNDLRALQVISAAQAVDLLVPEEVALLGANNDTIRCDLAYPPLSSVATNAFQSGYRAAECLDHLMAGRQPESFDVRIEPVDVVTRHSTDILAIDDKNVAAALSFIRENASRGITVEDVLRHAFASRSVLEKKLRRFLGRSPQAEIRRVQVARIRQLLLETDFPLKKIAELTGFEHVEYMCVVFKRLTGRVAGRIPEAKQGEDQGLRQRASIRAARRAVWRQGPAGLQKAGKSSTGRVNGRIGITSEFGVPSRASSHLPRPGGISPIQGAAIYLHS